MNIVDDVRLLNDKIVKLQQKPLGEVPRPVRPTKVGVSNQRNPGRSPKDYVRGPIDHAISVAGLWIHCQTNLRIESMLHVWYISGTTSVAWLTRDWWGTWSRKDMPVDQLSACLRKMRFALGATVRRMERKGTALSRNAFQWLPLMQPMMINHAW